MPVTLISGSSFTVNQEEVTHVEKPTFVDMRLGLEVTLYISNR